MLVCRSVVLLWNDAIQLPIQRHNWFNAVGTIPWRNKYIFCWHNGVDKSPDVGPIRPSIMLYRFVQLPEPFTKMNQEWRQTETEAPCITSIIVGLWLLQQPQTSCIWHTALINVFFNAGNIIRAPTTVENIMHDNYCPLNSLDVFMLRMLLSHVSHSKLRLPAYM